MGIRKSIKKRKLLQKYNHNSHPKVFDWKWESKFVDIVDQLPIFFFEVGLNKIIQEK